MRIVNFETRGVPGVAADEGSGWHGLLQSDKRFPGTLPELIAQGADLLRVGRSLGRSPAVDLKAVRLLPPVPAPPQPDSTLDQVLGLLHDRQSLAAAFLLREIFAPPVSRRPRLPRDR